MLAFVYVLGTVDALVTGGATACVGAVYRTCVAYRIGVARIARAGVVQVAEETWNEEKSAVREWTCATLGRQMLNFANLLIFLYIYGLGFDIEGRFQGHSNVNYRFSNGTPHLYICQIQGPYTYMALGFDIEGYLQGH